MEDRCPIGADSDPNALLFPGRNGDYLTNFENRRAFDPAAKDIGVPRLVPHELRHTCASLAIGAGANVKAVHTLLGHASAVMTLDLYGHRMSDDLTNVAKSLNNGAIGALKDSTAVRLRHSWKSEVPARILL